MSSLFNDLYTGLNQAIDYEKGTGQAKKTTYVISPVTEYSCDEIKKIRNNAGMTQSVFASYMGVSKKTVEAWECGKSNPTPTAKKLMYLIETDPSLVEKLQIN